MSGAPLTSLDVRGCFCLCPRRFDFHPAKTAMLVSIHMANYLNEMLVEDRTFTTHT